MGKVHTHNLSANILDKFEDLLEQEGITIPDKNRQGEKTEARLFGLKYDQLLEEVECLIIDELERKDIPHVHSVFI